MKEKRFYICAELAVPLLLLAFGIAACILPDNEISKTERRRLAAAPELSVETLFDGSYMKELENYLLDQFAGREAFRTLRTEFLSGAMRMKDSDGYFKEGDALYKLEYELNEKNVQRAAENFARISEMYFPKAEIYYAVIPDKNYYLPKNSSYPVLSHVALDTIMEEYFTGAKAIELYETLSLKDYYRTDLHWRQERILPAVELLMNRMKINEPQTDSMRTAYGTEMATTEFYGSYAGASAFATEPDTINYLMNEVLSSATVYDFETGGETAIYREEKLGGMDDYDFFLGGARALLTLEQKNGGQSEKKLLLFRDSFGSSIAPLFLAEYKTVTLIDLRYVTIEYAEKLLGEMEYDDVLFLYSASVLNHSDSMRF